MGLDCIISLIFHAMRESPSVIEDTCFSSGITPDVVACHGTSQVDVHWTRATGFVISAYSYMPRSQTFNLSRNEIPGLYGVDW